jgi:hypothetical protein
MAMVNVGLDNVSARRQVGIRVAWIVIHGEGRVAGLARHMALEQSRGVGREGVGEGKV